MNPEQVEAIQVENQQLRQLCAQKDAILHQRNEPVLCMVIDALNALSQMAVQGHSGAKDLLEKWRQANANAEAAAARLMVVRGHLNGGPPR